MVYSTKRWQAGSCLICMAHSEESSHIPAKRGGHVMKLWYNRTLLEQGLLVTLCCALIVILALSITVGVRNRDGWGCDIPKRDPEGITVPAVDVTKEDTHSNDHLQYSKECIVSASEVDVSPELRLDPCDNFYDFACRDWIDQAVLSENGAVSPMSIAEEQIQMRIKETLEEDVDYNTVPEHFEKARTFYAACTNWAGREDVGVNGFLTDLDYFGGFPTLIGDDWNASTFHYADACQRIWDRGFNLRFFINLNITADPRNISKSILSLGAPEVLPFDLHRRPKLVDLYLEFASEFLSYLCTKLPNDTCVLDTSVELREAILVEMELYQIFSSIPDKVIVMKIASLQTFIKDLDWMTLIRSHLKNTRAVDSNDDIVVKFPVEALRSYFGYLQDLDATDQGRRSLANYLIWRLILQAAPDLTQEMWMIYYEFKSYLHGRISFPSDHWECFHQTKTLFRFSIPAVYFAKYMPDFFLSTEPFINKIIKKLHGVIKKSINETYWLDDLTKKEASKKLDKLFVITGYPKGLLSETKVNNYYKKLKIGSSHYENVRNGMTFLKSKRYENFGKVLDRTSLEVLPTDLLSPFSGGYIAENNCAYIPAGVIQCLLGENNPVFTNFARIGVYISAVFAQVLDSIGSTTDGAESQNTWWQDEIKDRFSARSLCFSKLLEDLTLQRNNSLNERKILLEIIADDTGIKNAYRAFREERNGKQFRRPPGVDFDENQIFWLAFATAKCEKTPSKWFSFENRLSPEYRVNIPLSNNNDFARDFNCQFGTKMNPDDQKCRVWGS